MDNNQQHNDVQAAAPDHGHQSSHFQADVASAKLAYEAWSSNDPEKIDHALAERDRLSKHDPKAWKEAMKEIDGDQKEAKLAAAREKEMQAELAREQAEQQQAAPPLSQEYANDTAPPPAQANDQGQAPQEVAPQGVDPRISASASDSQFAPPPPNTTAYNAFHGGERHIIFGIDTPILKFGINNHHSLQLGVNVGLASAGVSVGAENRVQGEVLPISPALHGRVNAGVDFEDGQVRGEAGAGANVFNIAGGDLDAEGHIGQDIGGSGDLRGRALIVNGGGDAGVSLGPDGFAVHGGGNADLAQAIGARGGGNFNLGPHDVGGGAGVGLKAGNDTLDFGPSIHAYPTGEVRPAVNLIHGEATAPAFFPTGDLDIDQQQK